MERRKKRESETPEDLFSFKTAATKFKMFKKEASRAMQTPEEKKAEELKEFSNLVFFELSSFIKYFSNFEVTFELANSLLTEAVEKFMTDREKAHNLYTELSSSQSNSQHMFSA